MKARKVRCAAYACGREWTSRAQNPECRCGADAFDVDDGGWNQPRQQSCFQCDLDIPHVCGPLRSPSGEGRP